MVKCVQKRLGKTILYFITLKLDGKCKMNEQTDHLQDEIKANKPLDNNRNIAAAVMQVHRNPNTGVIHFLSRLTTPAMTKITVEATENSPRTEVDVSNLPQFFISSEETPEKGIFRRVAAEQAQSLLANNQFGIEAYAKAQGIPVSTVIQAQGERMAASLLLNSSKAEQVASQYYDAASRQRESNERQTRNVEGLIRPKQETLGDLSEGQEALAILSHTRINNATLRFDESGNPAAVVIVGTHGGVMAVERGRVLVQGPIMPIFHGVGIKDEIEGNAFHKRIVPHKLSFVPQDRMAVSTNNVKESYIKQQAKQTKQKAENIPVDDVQIENLWYSKAKDTLAAQLAQAKDSKNRINGENNGAVYLTGSSFAPNAAGGNKTSRGVLIPANEGYLKDLISPNSEQLARAQLALLTALDAGNETANSVKELNASLKEVGVANTTLSIDVIQKINNLFKEAQKEQVSNRPEVKYATLEVERIEREKAVALHPVLGQAFVEAGLLNQQDLDAARTAKKDIKPLEKHFPALSNKETATLVSVRGDVYSSAKLDLQSEYLYDMAVDNHGKLWQMTGDNLRRVDGLSNNNVSRGVNELGETYSDGNDLVAHLEQEGEMRVATTMLVLTPQGKVDMAAKAFTSIEDPGPNGVIGLNNLISEKNKSIFDSSKMLRVEAQGLGAGVRYMFDTSMNRESMALALLMNNIANATPSWKAIKELYSVNVENQAAPDLKNSRPFYQKQAEAVKAAVGMVTTEKTNGRNYPNRNQAQGKDMKFQYNPNYTTKDFGEFQDIYDNASPTLKRMISSAGSVENILLTWANQADLAKQIATPAIEDGRKVPNAIQRQIAEHPSFQNVSTPWFSKTKNGGYKFGDIEFTNDNPVHIAALAFSNIVEQDKQAMKALEKGTIKELPQEYKAFVHVGRGLTAEGQSGEKKANDLTFHLKNSSYIAKSGKEVLTTLITSDFKVAFDGVHDIKSISLFNNGYPRATDVFESRLNKEKGTMFASFSTRGYNGDIKAPGAENRTDIPRTPEDKAFLREAFDFVREQPEALQSSVSSSERKTDASKVSAYQKQLGSLMELEIGDLGRDISPEQTTLFVTKKYDNLSELVGGYVKDGIAESVVPGEKFAELASRAASDIGAEIVTIPRGQFGSTVNTQVAATNIIRNEQLALVGYTAASPEFKFFNGNDFGLKALGASLDGNIQRPSSDLLLGYAFNSETKELQPAGVQILKPLKREGKNQESSYNKSDKRNFARLDGELYPIGSMDALLYAEAGDRVPVMMGEGVASSLAFATLMNADKDNVAVFAGGGSEHINKAVNTLLTYASSKGISLDLMLAVDDDLAGRTAAGKVREVIESNSLFAETTGLAVLNVKDFVPGSQNIKEDRGYDADDALRTFAHKDNAFAAENLKTIRENLYEAATEGLSLNNPGFDKQAFKGLILDSEMAEAIDLQAIKEQGKELSSEKRQKMSEEQRLEALARAKNGVALEKATLNHFDPKVRAGYGGLVVAGLNGNYQTSLADSVERVKATVANNLFGVGNILTKMDEEFKAKNIKSPLLSTLMKYQEENKPNADKIAKAGGLNIQNNPSAVNNTYASIGVVLSSVIGSAIEHGKQQGNDFADIDVHHAVNGAFKNAHDTLKSDVASNKEALLVLEASMVFKKEILPSESNEMAIIIENNIQMEKMKSAEELQQQMAREEQLEREDYNQMLKGSAGFGMSS